MFSFQVFEFKLKQSDKNDKYLHSDVIETIKILGHLSQEQRLWGPNAPVSEQLTQEQNVQKVNKRLHCIQTPSPPPKAPPFNSLTLCKEKEKEVFFSAATLLPPSPLC